MKKVINFLTIFLIVFLFFSITNTGCKLGFEDTAEEDLYVGRNQDRDTDIDDPKVKEEESVIPENILPVAIMKVYQQNSSGDYFTVGNPVHFSAADSSDADSDVLSFRWQIGNMGTITGEEISYIFDSAGEYIITLMVNDGSGTVTVSKKIYLTEFNKNILVAKSYEAVVGMEYIITNNGPGDIDDVICLIQIPQTYQPFQIIKSRKSNYSKTDEIYSDDYNLVARFNLGNLSVGQSTKAYINCDAVLAEYQYTKIEDSTYTYDPEDSDLSLYTKSEYYINSNSYQIKSTVENVVGQETNPVIIAEKLYNYVANRMVYDEEKLTGEEASYSYASDILQKGKGVCTDYSILYTALCRSAGIPAKFVQGIPVFSILTEGGGSLPYAHSWVEIKLPGYGWIPIDITAESGFMTYNYYLNMEIYKGSGAFFKSISIDGENYYPNGFYYSWKGNTEPEVKRETIYSVSGINQKDISVVSENDFLDEVGSLLSDYNAAINHVNSLRSGDWIFNDSGEIAIEETFLARLMELSRELEEINCPESYTADMNNLVEISHEINLHKEKQLECMKNNNYDCSVSEYALFIDSLTELFDYYNGMIQRFNQKY